MYLGNKLFILMIPSLSVDDFSATIYHYFSSTRILRGWALEKSKCHRDCRPQPIVRRCIGKSRWRASQNHKCHSRFAVNRSQPVYPHMFFPQSKVYFNWTELRYRLTDLVCQRARRTFAANQRIHLEENLWQCPSVIGRNQATRPDGTGGRWIDIIRAM